MENSVFNGLYVLGFEVTFCEVVFVSKIDRVDATAATFADYRRISNIVLSSRVWSG